MAPRTVKAFHTVGTEGAIDSWRSSNRRSTAGLDIASDYLRYFRYGAQTSGNFLADPSTNPPVIQFPSPELSNQQPPVNGTGGENSLPDRFFELHRYRE